MEGKWNKERKEYIDWLISSYIAILVNIRDAVQVAEFWDEGQDGASELNKLILPVLVASLNYDIQEAATKTTAAVTSGVSVYKSNRMTMERERVDKDFYYRMLPSMKKRVKSLLVLNNLCPTKR